MSAYLLSIDFFTQLARTLTSYATASKYSEFAHAVDTFLYFGTDPRLQPHVRAVEIARELCKLNLQAVSERYPHDHHTIADEMKIVENWTVLSWAPVQFFKHLQCLEYQMSEGKVPDTERYKALKKLLDAVARQIVAKMAEYDQAAWGIAR